MNTTTIPASLAAALVTAVRPVDATHLELTWADGVDHAALIWTDAMVSDALSLLDLSDDTHEVHGVSAEGQTEIVVAKPTVKVMDFGSGPATKGGSDWYAALYLDPDDRSVAIHTQYGNGTPMTVWHNRALLVTVPSRVDCEALQEAVKENLDKIAAIFDLWEGTEWNGSNNVGRWSSDDDGVSVDNLVSALEEDLRETASYADAGAWLECDWSGARNEVRKVLVKAADEGTDEDDALDALARDWTDSGASDDTLLDVADVRRQIDKMVEQIREEEADEDDDSDDGQPTDLQEHEDFAHDNDV